MAAVAESRAKEVNEILRMLHDYQNTSIVHADW